MECRPAALDGDCCEPCHQPPPDPAPPRPLADIEVLEVEPRLPEPGRKIRVKQRKPGRLIVDRREERLKAAFRPEPVPTQVVLGSDHRARCLLVCSQLADQLKQQTDILGCGETEDDNARHLRHSPAAVAGWPKSRGARPE